MRRARLDHAVRKGGQVAARAQDAVQQHARGWRAAIRAHLAPAHLRTTQLSSVESGLRHQASRVVACTLSSVSSAGAVSLVMSGDCAQQQLPSVTTPSSLTEPATEHPAAAPVPPPLSA